MATDLRALADCPTEAELRKAEAAARMRSFGIADAEAKLRRQRALELAEALRTPLVPSHPPTDLERLAELAPRARPAPTSSTRTRRRP